MNDKTIQLIERLAEKIGTTSEHLWSVLIKQSYLSGAFNIIGLTVWFVFLAWLYRFLAGKTTPPKATEHDSCPRAEWDDDGIAMFICIILIGASVFVVICDLDSIFGSLINPEYWALKQIVK